MPATLEEVKQLIQEGFPNSESEIVEEDHRIVGTIYSNEFKKLDARERNRLVSTRVRNKLGSRGINIGFILPLAPGDKL